MADAGRLQHGPPPSTSTRIYQSAFFALRDTKTPARVATLRVATAAVCGFLLMLQFQPVTVFSLSIPAGAFASWQVSGIALGPVGLALGAAVGAWLEWILLHGRLKQRIGDIGAGLPHLARMWAAALLAAAAGYGVQRVTTSLHLVIVAHWSSAHSVLSTSALHGCSACRKLRW